MKITHESICEKLGYDPLVELPPGEIPDHEDDSKPSPLAALTLEESDFLLSMVLEKIKQKQ